MGNQINKPNLHFNPLAYTGNNANGNSITGVGFQPDFVWAKRRSGDTNDNVLFDVVRGATKRLISNVTTAETTNTDTLSAFNSDGFTVNQNDTVNAASPYITWNWLADNTSGSSNTDGSITSTVAKNTTSGFSIVSYTGNSTAGATVGHGLGVAPAFIFGKNRTGGTDGWSVYHKSLGGTKAIYLNETGASTTTSAEWNNTNPSSTVVTLGNGNYVNRSSGSIILYCFAEKKGFSKFGSYTGNGSTDGTFVYCGFKPAFILVKSSDNTTEWHMSDDVRYPTNPNNAYLAASSNAAEVTGYPTDFLSNGFKMRTTLGGWNYSGWNFIYAAFAKNPLVGTNKIPATAR